MAQQRARSRRTAVILLPESEPASRMWWRCGRDGMGGYGFVIRGKGEPDLTRANLSRARLRGADLRSASVDGVDLSSLDLKDVKLDVGQAILLARCLGAEVDLEG